MDGSLFYISRTMESAHDFLRNIKECDLFLHPVGVWKGEPGQDIVCVEVIVHTLIVREACSRTDSSYEGV